MRAERGESPPLEEVLTFLRGWRELPREKVLQAFEGGHFAGVEEMKRNHRLFDRIAPLGVNDIIMAVQYKYDEASSSPLNVPLMVFEGKRDNTIPAGYMRGWRKHTKSSYEHVYIDGTHYFVSSHYHELTSKIGNECLKIIGNMDGGILGHGHSWIREFDLEVNNQGHSTDDELPRSDTTTTNQRKIWNLVYLYLLLLFVFIIFLSLLYSSV